VSDPFVYRVVKKVIIAADAMATVKTSLTKLTVRGKKILSRYFVRVKNCFIVIDIHNALQITHM
jgi:hypothetical protein